MATKAVEAPSARRHPLEPLTGDEIRCATEQLKRSGSIGDGVRFVSAVAIEPLKAVLRQGETPPRRARVVAVDRGANRLHDAVVDLDKGVVERCVEVPEAQPSLTVADLLSAIKAVKADPRWQEALRKRGVTDLDQVQVDPWPPGDLIDDEHRGLPIARALSYVRTSRTDNGYAHPVEGVIAYVDLQSESVVKVEDHGSTPVPMKSANYDSSGVSAYRSDVKPLEIHQPEGPSFEIDGHRITWQKWSLRVSMHPLDGLVLHTVSYSDADRERSILHRASLSEMVVPYGDASPAHSWKNVFDAGEYGFARFTDSLALGCDCLGEIRYFDVTVVDEDGEPRVIENGICVHEEDYGVLWRHRDHVLLTTEVRRSRRLVVSSFHGFGNYDYGLFWYLYQDGTLQFEVKLTGILQTKALDSEDTLEHAALIDEGLAAPHHQHLFNVRLDFDLDGGDNSCYERDVVPTPPGEANPRGNAFRVQSTLLASEADAARLTDERKARTWVVCNPNVLNSLGKPVGYRLVPSGGATLLADAGSPVARRAGFATRSLWVTRFDEGELRAAGEYPNQSRGGDGLPNWVNQNRSLENTDIVLWHTFGTTHTARPEDWPVMPVEYAGFTLKPFGFFDRNPALDVPAPGHR